MNSVQSMSSAAESLSLSMATVKRAIQSLKAKGLIERVGGKGKVQWIVK